MPMVVDGGSDAKKGDDDDKELEVGDCRDEEVLEDGGGRLQHFAGSSSSSNAQAASAQAAAN